VAQAPRLFSISAKGASFICSLGQRPRDSTKPKTASAEGAIHPSAILCNPQTTVESRFQRLFVKQSNPGAMPQA
jgi:hypothetical protein